MCAVQVNAVAVSDVAGVGDLAMPRKREECGKCAREVTCELAVAGITQLGTLS